MSTEQTNIRKASVKEIKEMTMHLPGSVCGEYVFIQELPVEDEGKYQYESYIFLHTPTRKFYMYTNSRSGSYFSEYNREYNEDKEGNVILYQVRLTPVQAFTWAAVK